MGNVNGPDGFKPLPSDGTPHVIDDVEGAEVDECRCVDCRVAKLVEIELCRLAQQRNGR